MPKATRRRQHRHHLAVLLCAALAGCGGKSGGGGTDGSVDGPDGATWHDARSDVWQVDAAPADVGPMDVSSPDVQEPDAQVPPGPKPIMIAAANYVQYQADLRQYAPYIVYAWCSDPAIQRPGAYEREIQLLESIADPGVEKWVMYSSLATMREKLSNPSHVQQLHQMGVTTLGFNTEGGITPDPELQTLQSPDPNVNVVALFASEADAHGFQTVWGPIRMVLENTRDQVVTMLFEAGLDGIALQEQNFINSACVQERATAVHQTAERYAQLAGRDIHVCVQVMPSTCLEGDTWAQQHANECGWAPTETYGQCTAFVEAILPDVDSIAIWAMGPDRQRLPDLVAAIRSQ